MKLWADTDSIKSAGRAVQAKVSEMTADINHQSRSRGARAVNALRNAELEVLKGQRSGREYRKYPYKSKYIASAPGEAPARRSGNLRLHWTGDVVARQKQGNGVEVVAFLESQEKYAYYLEEGKGMEARPFVEKIKKKALPEIEKIYNRPFT